MKIIRFVTPFKDNMGKQNFQKFLTFYLILVLGTIQVTPSSVDEGVTNVPSIPTLALNGGGKIPIVGLGTGSITPGVDPEESIQRALINGYRHIDTAYAYRVEKAIGNVLKRWFDGGKLKREDVFITSKLPQHGNDPSRVEYFLNKSLKDLQTDYVDLYLIHHPVGIEYNNTENVPFSEWKVDPNPVDHVGIWKKMEEQVDAGRIKAIGVSNFNISQIQNILNNAKIKPSAVEVRLNVYHQQKKLVDFCHKNGIQVIAYSPLGRPQDLVPRKGIVAPSSPNQLKDPVVEEIAKKYSKTPGQILLKYNVQRNIVVIPKSSSDKHQKENLDIFDFTISDEDFKKLETLDRQGTKDETKFFFVDAFMNHPNYPQGI